jgi:hypothetical protein
MLVVMKNIPVLLIMVDDYILHDHKFPFNIQSKQNVELFGMERQIYCNWNNCSSHRLDISVSLSWRSWSLYFWICYGVNHRSYSNINSTEAFNNKKERFLAFISLFPIPTFWGIHIVRLTLNIDRPVVSGDDIDGWFFSVAIWPGAV